MGVPSHCHSASQEGRAARWGHSQRRVERRPPEESLKALNKCRRVLKAAEEMIREINAIDLGRQEPVIAAPLVEIRNKDAQVPSSSTG